MAERSRTGTTQTSGWTTFGYAACTMAMLLYAAGIVRGDGTERGLVIGPIMMIVGILVSGRLRQRYEPFDLGGIVFAAVGVKLCAVYGRLWMVESLYGGNGDSSDYDVYGRVFAPQFRSFDFAVDPGKPVPGTGFLRVLTGVVYAIFGADKFTGFIIFGMMSLLGCWFFYRAFTAALPDGDHKRYALLVFFWPSLLFWPAAIGKEAWMVMSLGLASWGAASVYRHVAHGFPLLALGILGAAMPRPHIAIVVLAASAVGLATATFFGAGAGGRKVGAATKVVGIIFLLVTGALLAPKVATFLNIDDIGGSGFDDSLSAATHQTSEGGSTFAAPEITTPLDYPWAFVTVLFRPLPFEVNNAGTLVSALEGLSLLALLAFSVRKLARVPAELVRNAYVAYAAAFAFMFVYVFAFIGNFGILARQRTQMLPFLFVLIALPAAAPKALGAASRRRTSRGSAELPPDDLRPGEPRRRSTVPTPPLAPPRDR